MGKNNSGLPPEFYHTIYSEVGGGVPEEVAAVASVFLNRAEKHGMDKALSGSSAYKLKSKEYRKAESGKMTTYEKEVYERNRGIVDNMVSNPQFRLPYTHFENVRAFGEPKWAKGAKVKKDIGRQRFYQINE